MKFELNRNFNINVDDIEETYDFHSNIRKAIEKMKDDYDKQNLEILLNGNLLNVKNKLENTKAIFGIKVSLADLEKDISFIVRECEPEPNYKEKYFELKNKIDNFYEKEINLWLKYGQAQRILGGNNET